MHQSDRGNLPFIVLKLEHFADKEKCIFKSEFFKKKKKKPSILVLQLGYFCQLLSSEHNTFLQFITSLAQASLSNGWRHMLLISSATASPGLLRLLPLLLHPHCPRLPSSSRTNPRLIPPPASLTEQHCLLAWQEASREKEGAGNTRSFESQSCG